MMSISSIHFSGRILGPKSKRAPELPSEPVARLGKILERDAVQNAKDRAEKRHAKVWKPIAHNAKSVLEQTFVSYKGVNISGKRILQEIIKWNEAFEHNNADPSDVAFIEKELHFQNFPKEFAHALRALEKAGLIKFDSKYNSQQVYKAVSEGFREVFPSVLLLDNPKAQALVEPQAQARRRR